MRCAATKRIEFEFIIIIIVLNLKNAHSSNRMKSFFILCVATPPNGIWWTKKKKLRFARFWSFTISYLILLAEIFLSLFSSSGDRKHSFAHYKFYGEFWRLWARYKVVLQILTATDVAFWGRSASGNCFPIHLLDGQLSWMTKQR